MGQQTRKVTLTEIAEEDLNRMNEVKDALADLSQDQRMHVIVAIVSGTMARNGQRRIEINGARDDKQFQLIATLERV